MMHKLILTILCVLFFQFAFAQKEIRGKITDAADNTGLPGVNVLIKGTSVGTSTDAAGNFPIPPPPPANGIILVFTYVGYESVEMPLGGQTAVNLSMKQISTQLDELVVTALNVKREAKSLGYAISTIKSAELVKSGNIVNPLMALYGKAAGVRIASTVNGPSGGMIVNIRNSVSLNEKSSTRPLFVVDGIPIYDQNTTSDDNPQTGRDRGTGINDINATDIESIEILKGAKAAVLYGYAGANGVVLITTKSGAGKKGLGIDFSMSNTWDQVAFTPKFQNVYGSGRNASRYAPEDTDADGFRYGTVNGQRVPVYTAGNGSFGPKMDGRQVYWYDSTFRSYEAQPDNYKRLFRQGGLRTVNVSLTNSGDLGNFRFGYSNKGFISCIEGADQQNHTFSFTANMKVNKFVNIQFNTNYYYTQNHNAPYRNQRFATYGIPRDMKTDLLRSQIADGDGYFYFARHRGIATNAGSTLSESLADGYLWNQTQNTYDLTRHHLIQAAQINVDLSKSFNLAILGGADITRNDELIKNKVQRPLYLDPLQCYYSEKNEQHNSYYGQALLNYNKDLTKDFKLTATGGGVIRYNSDRYLQGITQHFSIENLFQFNNSTNVQKFSGEGDLGDDITYSLLGSANLAYKEFLFLELQGRNDWTSIMPPSNNSYFYPGTSLSWVVSESFQLPQAVSYAKLRLSAANVGRPGTRYFGNTIYDNGLYGSTPFATAGSSLPPAQAVAGRLIPNLRPERKSEIEAGAEAKFFNKRLGFDLSVYRNNSYDQIMALTVPQSSGVKDIRVNAGDVQNTGIELQLTAVPVQTKNFTWENTFNISRNISKVNKLANGVTIFPLWGVSGAYANAVVGESYGGIYINPWKRNDNGDLVIGANGLYQTDKSKTVRVGQTLPNVIGGYNATFQYKNFRLSLDFDYQFGGTLISATNMYGRGNGTFVESLKYRDEANGGSPYYVNKAGSKVALPSHSAPVPNDSKYSFIFHDGVILKGVKEDGTPNNVINNAEDYYRDTYWQSGLDAQEDVIYKSDYLAFRRAAFTYNIPTKLFHKNNFIRHAEFGVFIFNVDYLYKDLPNVIPESTAGTNSFSEVSGLPGVRSLGCQLKLSF